MSRDGAQAVVWQTAVNPVVALELLADGAWSGAGVLGPEAFDPVPFLDLLPEYGAPWRLQERTRTDPAALAAAGSAAPAGTSAGARPAPVTAHREGGQR